MDRIEMKFKLKCSFQRKRHSERAYEVIAKKNEFNNFPAHFKSVFPLVAQSWFLSWKIGKSYVLEIYKFNTGNQM